MILKDLFNRYEELVPALLSIILIIFSKLMPISLYEFTPRFELIVIFYFLYFNPELISFTFLFILGITYDIFFSGIVGISAFCYITSALVFLNFRNLLKNRPFSFLWICFLNFYLVFAFSNLIVISIIDSSFHRPNIIATQSIICFLCYPAFHSLFNRFKKDGIYI